MPVKLEWLGYRTVKKLWQYVEPFSSDTGALRTDGQTDRQTDGQNAISISRVSVLTRDKKVAANNNTTKQTNQVRQQDTYWQTRGCSWNYVQHPAKGNISVADCMPLSSLLKAIKINGVVECTHILKTRDSRRISGRSLLIAHAW